MAFADTTLKTYAETSKAMFDYWISFHPAAPMFGVEWRFGEAFMPVFEEPAPEPSADAPVEAEAATGTAAEMVTLEAAVAEADADADAVVEAAGAEETEAAVEEVAEETDVSALLYSTPPAEIDDLKVLKGVGPSLETQLHNLGIYKFEQLAAFDQAQLEWLDENLNTVKGRCIRDDWAGQARALIA